MARRSLEDLLLEEGLLDDAGLRQARRHARRAGVSLVRAVVEQRQLTEGAVADMLVRRLHLPRVDLSHELADDEALREVPHDLADARRLLPLSVDRSSQRRVIRLAMADPLDLDAVEEIEMSTGCTVDARVAGVIELGDAIQRTYRGVITKMIPRRPAFGPGSHTPAAAVREPTTQPNHLVADEASVEVRLTALVELLVEKGLLDRDAYHEAVRKLFKEHSEG